MEFARRRTTLLVGALTLAELVLGSAAGCRRAAPPSATARPDARAGGPPTFSMSGRVTDEADRPIPEARVLVLGPLGDAGATARREARSDLAGRFALEGLPRGRYGLLVEAVGLASIEPGPVDVPGAAPVVRLSGQGRSLSGSVTVGTAPVAGARVRLAGEDGPLARETLSDEAGGFVFHGLGAGPYTLRATKGNLASAFLHEIAPAAGPVAVALAAGLGVEGLVVDDAGRALGGAEVRAEATLDDPLADATRSGADGHFRLGPLPPGRFRLVARAPTYLLRAPASVMLAATTATPAQRLELVRAASAEGRVSDVRGASIPGALIRYGGGGAGLTDLAVIFDPLPLAAEAAALEGKGRGGGAAKLARADANGEFRLDDLLPGPVRLAITRPPYAALELETASVAPGEHRILGVRTLGDPTADAGAAVAVPALPAEKATLAGIARDDGGRPLARARVRAWPLDAAGTTVTAAPRTAAIASTVTDPGGHFTLARVPAATLLLELDLPPYPVTFASTTPDLP